MVAVWSSLRWVASSKWRTALALYIVYRILRRVTFLVKYRGKKMAPRLPYNLPFALDGLVHGIVNFRQPLENMERFRKQLGNTFRYGAMGRKEIAVFDPDSIQHFLAKNWENYEKGPGFRLAFDPLLGQGIFNVNGDDWKRHRATARPHFAKVELGHMVPTFIAHGKYLLDRLEKSCKTGKPIDLQDIFFRFTLDSVGDILFGHNIDSLNHESDFAAHFDFAQTYTGWRFLIQPLWKYIPNANYEKSIAYLNEFVEKVIEECENDPKFDERSDLLAEYMKGDPKPSREYLKDMLKNMLIAGRDTTAVLLTWLFYELSQNPAVLEKVLEEIDTVVGTGIPTPAQLDNMRYLKNVLNETLRLHPSVPVDVRTAVSDDYLPNGFFVEKNTTVFYFPYLTHRIPEFWGPDSEKFDPSRWEQDRIRHVPAFAFVPFHAGPRICLGQNMAYTEAKIAAIMVLQKFRLTLAPKFQPRYRGVIILMSENGMMMNVQHARRNPPQETTA